MTALSDAQRPLVEHIRALVGTRVPVAQYRDEDDVATVAMCIAADWPAPGLTTYATVGASEREVRDGLGVEFIAAGPSEHEELGDVLGTAATFVLREGWRPRPGVAFADVGRLAWPGTTLPHLLLVDPGPFRELGLETLQTDRRQVAYVMPLLISDAELAVVEELGADALEDLLEQAGIDVHDLQRPSVV